MRDKTTDMADLAIIVLAAGRGTRMKSDLPKVMHRAAGRSLLGHVLTTARALKPAHVVVVHGPGDENVKNEALAFIPKAQFAEQTERKGTGHAVMQAEAMLKEFKGRVLVLYGDAPLILPSSLQPMLNVGSPMTVLAFRAANPTGYGRLITSSVNKVIAIREELDATPEERKITLCNSGIISISNELLWQHIKKLSNANAKGEYYLTDLAELVNAAGDKVAFTVCDEADVAGVNDRVQLASIEVAFQQRYRNVAMLNGATLIDPATTYFSADTVMGRDVVIEPNVFFGPGVTIGDNVGILSCSHIEGATIAKGARIGPFARLRPGAEVGENAHVGNYVEIKKSRLGKGAKVNHLTYIGDATVGAGSNIGAGTITCNYDGFEKHLTEIGENVFVGSNTALVAPVRIGSGANIAAGSVITESVPEDALAMTRPALTMKPGWAKRYRAMKQARKAQRPKP